MLHNWVGIVSPQDKLCVSIVGKFSPKQEAIEIANATYTKVDMKPVKLNK